jgi:hypothetical protein
MNFSTLLLGATLVALPLIGAALLGTIILLERPEPLPPVAASGAPNGATRGPPRRKTSRRRR